MKKNTLPHEHCVQNNLENIEYELLKIEHFDIVSDIFKQLSDTTRIRIFWLLCHTEQCVINISALMNMSSPAVSHHLRILRSCGLIESYRTGKEVYYKASNNSRTQLLHNMIEKVMEIACPVRKD